MNRLKLRETMQAIHMSEEMKEELMMRVREKSAYRKRRVGKLKWAAAAAATFVLVLGAAGPIQAGIRYLVEERMEQIPQEELEAVNDMLQTQTDVQADAFSRAFTSEERAREKELREAYKKGRFPEQTLPRTEMSGKPTGDVLFYDAASGTFCLPERPMTDEELLQIIDFQYTSDYALAKSDAAEQARKERAQEEERLRADAGPGGLLTEEEARAKARIYMETELGLSAEGMQTDSFLDQRPDGTCVYHVSFQTEDDTALLAYSIDVNARDGSFAGSDAASGSKAVE